MIKKQKLFCAKDYLVSGESFEVYWDNERKRAETKVKDKNKLFNYYQSDNYDSHKKDRSGFIDFLYFASQKVMFKYKENILIKHDPGKKVLDYGSGIGMFASYLSNKGYNTYLIEPFYKAKEIAKKKGLKVYESIENLPKQHLFNCITLWHVLEHIPQPEKIIGRLKNHLELDGKIFIALPNFKSFDSKYYERHWAALDVPRHLWHFTSEGIIKTLESSGFELVKKYPLWLDAIYISYLSEKYCGKRLSLIKGLFIGLLSNIKALFNHEYSSLVYVFKVKTS